MTRQSGDGTNNTDLEQPVLTILILRKLSCGSTLYSAIKITNNTETMKGGSKNAPFMFCDKSFSTHYIKSCCTFLGISCQDKAGIQPCVANQSSSHQTSPAPARALPQTQCWVSGCVKCHIRVSVAKHLSNLSPISLNSGKASHNLSPYSWHSGKLSYILTCLGSICQSMASYSISFNIPWQYLWRLCKLFYII